MFSYIDNGDSFFSCEGEYVEKNDVVNLSGILRFEFTSENKGFIVFSGNVINDGGNISIVRIKAFFQYKKIKNQYFITLKKSIEFIDNEKKTFNEAILLLPDFFSGINNEHQLGVYKINENGYVFYNIITPVLYCHKTNI